MDTLLRAYELIYTGKEMKIRSHTTSLLCTHTHTSRDTYTQTTHMHTHMLTHANSAHTQHQNTHILKRLYKTAFMFG